jgi:hypothetical protein
MTMKKIFKFVLAGTGKSYPTIVEVPMNIDAKILCVANQLEKTCLWAEVETTAPTETRTFKVVLTGESPETDGFNSNFLATIILKGGTSVAHVYELTTLSEPEPEHLM